MTFGTPYPAEPIRVIVGFTPAGASDRLARAVFPTFGRLVGQEIIIDNRPGDAGNPAARFVASSAPDGYTLLLGNNGLLAANPTLFGDIGYDPVGDFAQVSLIGRQPSILVVAPRLGVTSLETLMALSRSKGERLFTAVSGHGSAAHLAAELFKTRAGLQFHERSFDGAEPALQALERGDVDLMFATASSVLERIVNGDLVAIATTCARRSPFLPGIATMAECGFDDFDVTSWHGLVAPRGTAASKIDCLHRALVAALREDSVKTKLEALAIEAVGSTPREFADHIAAEIPQWKKIVTMSGAVRPRVA